MSETPCTDVHRCGCFVASPLGHTCGAGFCPCGDVTITLPGSVVRCISEGSWHERDNPGAWTTLMAGTWRRVGRGRQLTATLPKTDAHDLADYLWSVAGAQAGMSADERAGDSRGRTATAGAERIERALRTNDTPEET